MAPPVCFTTTSSLDTAALAAWLGTTSAERGRVEREWYDTFDWSLWNAGLVLEAERAGDHLQVTLRDRDDHHVRWRQEVDRLPRRADELPPGPWRRTLGPLLGIRALIPIAAAAVDRTRLVLRNDDDKAVAEAEIERTTDGPTWVRVVPHRGNGRDAKRIRRRLAAHEDLAPSDDHPLRWFVRDQREPGRSGTELDLHLDPAQPATLAAREMLRHLFGVMRIVEPWITGAPDPEFVHDYRVALRRSRSVLKMARDVLPAEQLERWRPRLRELQQQTGPLRDLDVLVLELGSYRDALPDDYRDDLGPLAELLTRQRAAEQRRVERYLTGAGHRRFEAEYEAFLDQQDVPSADEAADGPRPIAEVGAERIRRAHRRVVRRGRRITDDSPAHDLHQVRIAGKELRYALELHASLLPERPRRALVKRLKTLQELLGGFQDAEVHAEAMQSFAEELVDSDAGSARCFVALGLLVGVFRDRQAELHAAFGSRFRAFDDPETAELVDEVLAGIDPRR